MFQLFKLLHLFTYLSSWFPYLRPTQDLLSRLPGWLAPGASDTKRQNDISGFDQTCKVRNMRQHPVRPSWIVATCFIKTPTCWHLDHVTWNDHSWMTRVWPNAETLEGDHGSDCWVANASASAKLKYHKPLQVQDRKGSLQVVSSV